MHETAFDTFARHAGSGHDRRASLKALAAAAMVAALGAPRTAVASKAGKKARQKCQKQVGACKSAFVKACGGDDLCLTLVPCCNFLRTCNAAGQIKCITDIL